MGKKSSEVRRVEWAVVKVVVRTGLGNKRVSEQRSEMGS